MVMPLNYRTEEFDQSTGEMTPDISIVEKRNPTNPESIYFLLEIIPKRTKQMTSEILEGLITISNSNTGNFRYVANKIYALLRNCGVKNLTPDLANMAVSRVVNFILSNDQEDVLRQIGTLASLYRKIKRVRFKPSEEVESEPLPFDEIETQETVTPKIDITELSQRELMSLCLELNKDLAYANRGKTLLDLYLSSTTLRTEGFKNDLKKAIRAFNSSVDELIQLSDQKKLNVLKLINRPNIGWVKLVLVLQFLQNEGLLHINAFAEA